MPSISGFVANEEGGDVSSSRLPSSASRAWASFGGFIKRVQSTDFTKSKNGNFGKYLDRPELVTTVNEIAAQFDVLITQSIICDRSESSRIVITSAISTIDGTVFFNAQYRFDTDCDARMSDKADYKLGTNADGVITGGKKMQAIGGEATYHSRYALCLALNIAGVPSDEDGEAIKGTSGATLSPKNEAIDF
jgi:hypothetical protein